MERLLPENASVAVLAQAGFGSCIDPALASLRGRLLEVMGSECRITFEFLREFILQVQLLRLSLLKLVPLRPTVAIGKRTKKADEQRSGGEAHRRITDVGACAPHVRELRAPIALSKVRILRIRIGW